MIIAYIRTVILYLVLVVVIRLMGKRQLGQMEPTEFVVTMLAANLVSIPMQDSGIPILSGLVPILTVLSLELILSTLSLRSLKFRRILCGKPVILIENGHILQDNLLRTRVTLDELTSQLRKKDVLDIYSVQYAILETDGNLSVFPFPKERPASAKDAGIQAKKQFLPITIISDGQLVRENLPLIDKDESWVFHQLETRRAAMKDVWLMTVDNADHIRFYKKEE